MSEIGRERARVRGEVEGSRSKRAQRLQDSAVDSHHTHRTDAAAALSLDEEFPGPG